MIRSIKKMFKSNYLFTLGVVICLAWILLAIDVYKRQPVNRFYSSFNRQTSMVSQHFSESRINATFHSIIRRWC